MASQQPGPYSDMPAAAFDASVPSVPPASPIPGVWRHHKGGLYRVLGVVRNATNGQGYQWMVQYVSLTFGEVYVRELDEFLGAVQVDGQDVRRFTFVDYARQAPEGKAPPCR